MIFGYIILPLLWKTTIFFNLISDSWILKLIWSRIPLFPNLIFEKKQDTYKSPTWFWNNSYKKECMDLYLFSYSYLASCSLDVLWNVFYSMIWMSFGTNLEHVSNLEFINKWHLNWSIIAHNVVVIWTDRWICLYRKDSKKEHHDDSCKKYKWNDPINGG